MKLEDLEAPTNDKEKNQRLEDDDMQEIEGTSLSNKVILFKQSKLWTLCIITSNDIQQLVCKDNVFTLNQNQCICLAQLLEQTTKNLMYVFSHVIVFPKDFDLLLKELFRIIIRAKLLVQQCHSEKWWHAALLQINNEEAFKDLILDLKCCYDDIFQHSKRLWGGKLDKYGNFLCFSLPNMRKLAIDDQHALIKQLQVLKRTTESFSYNKNLDGVVQIATYLLERVDNQTKYAKGEHQVEVDAEVGWKGSILIGQGGYGFVEKTFWFDLQCARKVQLLTDTKDADKSFKKEVAILASAHHPNVVKLICCGRKPKEGKCFIAMELLDTSLEDLIKELSNDGSIAPFPIQVAVEIMLQIAKGMSYLHEKHIVHRDLKPANILVKKMMVEELHKDNHVKLADFGLSKMDVNSHNSEIFSQGVGTRLYKAPELFQCTKVKANAYQGDVYSFGVVCSTILSGRTPFEGIDDLLTKLKLGVRPSLPDNCPKALVSLINKCWSQERQNRPKFKEICTKLKDLKSSILRGDVAFTNQESENGTSRFPRILKPFHLFWRGWSLEAQINTTTQDRRQVHTKVSQLHALVSPTWVFANGNKIIAPSRNWQDLKATCISHNEKMDMEVLEKDQAKQLFYKHASFQGQPQVSEFKEVANKVIEACCGLPLILEVLGSYLCGVPKLSVWQQAVQRLQRVQFLSGTWNDEKIWSILAISYDELNEVEKNMFLDIACFFCRDVLKEGMQEDKALKIWNGDYANANLVLLNLMGRNLVRIHADGTLEMHDILRDMGRMIAARDHTKGRRVWNLHELEPNQQNGNMTVPNVEGLHMDRSFGEKNWNTSKNLAHLRLLNIDKCKEVDSLYERIKDSSRLRWMRICMLDVDRDEGIEELQPSFFIPFKQLCVLEMTRFVHLRQLPLEIGTLSMLEYLTVSYSQNLKGLPQTLGNLTSLVTLDLSHCSNLEELPEPLGNLTSLVTLDLSHCGNLKELPETLGKLTSLVTLNLSQCYSLTELPKKLGNLTSLVTLDFSDCRNLKELPETLGKLTSLVTLNLSQCHSLTKLLETLGNLISLVTLDFSDCRNLEELPEPLGNLTSLVTLNLSQCHSLIELPKTLGNLTSLVTLDFSDCRNLKELPETLGKLTSLVTLNLSQCDSLRELPKTLGNLTSLVTLDLSHWRYSKELPETLGNLTSLVTLNLAQFYTWEELPKTLGNLTSLVTLDLSHWQYLKELPETLGNLTSLVTLDFSDCRNLKELPETLGKLTSLVTLNLSQCDSLRELPKTLGNLTSLVTLDLSHWRYSKELPETLGNLTSLVTLNLPQCYSWEELPETLGKLTSLVTLNLSQCDRLRELPKTLGNLTSLVTLNLSQCDSLRELPKTLGNLTSLVTLDLSGCRYLKELPETLGNLTSLVTLNLSKCHSLTELPETLGNLTSLVTLDLSSCWNLKQLPKTLGQVERITETLGQLERITETLGNFPTVRLHWLHWTSLNVIA